MTVIRGFAMSNTSLRRGLTSALTVIVLLSFAGAAQAWIKEGSKPPIPPKFVANELIIKFKSGAVPLPGSTEGMRASSFSAGSSITDSLFKKYGAFRIVGGDMHKPSRAMAGAFPSTSPQSLSGACKVTFSNVNARNIGNAAAEFKNDPDVEYAEPNYLFRICKVPNDPYFDRQWGLMKIAAAGGWDVKIGNPDIVIAVIDTGVDYTHPDLASNMWTNTDEIPGNGIDDDGNGYVDDVRGWDFVSVPFEWVAAGEDPGPEDNDPSDFVGHGTHVSGIAAGRSNNRIGTAGLTWDCGIMPVRAGYAASDGYGYLEYYDAGRALIYAADNGADVINMSWGGLEDSGFIRDSIAYAYGKGCVLVASAGNVTPDYATQPYYPAAYPGVIAVAATDEDDMLSIWSWDVFSNFGDFVDVCAPGTYVLSTLPGGNYGYYSGTSMSSPFVAGLAALIKSKFPQFTNDQIIKRLKDTADDIYSVNSSIFQGLLGSGRINAHRALGNILLSIDFPRSGAEVPKNMIIKGSADIENFSRYKIEYGAGENPDVWTPIGVEHATPVVNGVLERWDASALSGVYTIKLTVIDVSSESYSAASKINISSKADVEIVGDLVPGPNPFDPHRGTQKIYYELGAVPAGGVDVDVCVYDLTGKLLWKRTKHSAGPGVVDDLYWDGKNVFGETVSTGVYPCLLVADKKIIGKTKIAVAR